MTASSHRTTWYAAAGYELFALTAALGSVVGVSGVIVSALIIDSVQSEMLGVALS